MEDSEKTMALKKAYAEIILNTAKEAAVRVMVSEKKAARFQQDLSATKDEAVRLLVRWKQMTDAKTIEAEKTSLNQQKKIDELEAQLHEAEDIITDLRTELRCVQDKLEKVKKNQMQPLNVQITAEGASPQIDSMPAPTTHSPLNLGFVTTTNSDLRNDTLDQKCLDDKCYNALKQDEQSGVSHLESHFAHNSDITTMLMGGKEPEPYKNGCTQRIRALERKFLDERLLSPGGVEDPHLVLENELIMETSAEHDEKCLISSPKTKSMSMANFSRKEVKKPVKSRISRRRKTRFGRAKSTSRRSRAGQVIKPSPSSVLFHSKTYPGNNRSVKSDECLQTVSSIKDDNMDISGSEKELEYKSNCCNDESALIQKGKGCLKLESKDAIATSFKSHLCQFDETCCKTTSNSVSFNVNSGDNQLKIADNEAKIKPLPCWDPSLTLIKSDLDPISGSKNITVSSVKALNKCRLVQNIADKDMKLRDKSMLDRQEESDTRVISKLPSSELNSDLVSVPLTYSHLKDAKASEETDASPIKVANDRLLKYTFQRKRKKESFSDSDEKTSAENISLKKRAGGRQNNAEETEKPSLMNEMTRDSRRMAQVARQLISLSGKRWS